MTSPDLRLLISVPEDAASGDDLERARLWYSHSAQTEGTCQAALSHIERVLAGMEPPRGTLEIPAAAVRMNVKSWAMFLADQRREARR